MLIDVYCVYNDINYGDDGFIMFYWSSIISSQEDIYDHIMYHLCFRSLASNILGGLCCIAARWGIVGPIFVSNGEFDEEMMIIIGFE